jgi:hypothetical protein
MIKSDIFLKLKFSATFFLTVMSFFLFAQKTITLKGKVINKSTKEALIGATVFIPEKKAGTTTNASGEFEISTSENITRIKVAYIGYRDTTIVISNNISYYSIALVPAYKSLNEVQVISSKDDPQEKVNDMQMVK